MDLYERRQIFSRFGRKSLIVGGTKNGGTPIKETIREFIASNFLKGEESKTFGDNDSFLEEGIIDSVGVMELVAFLEETFNFRVEDEEIIPANLDSINKLVVYVQSKLTSNNS